MASFGYRYGKSLAETILDPFVTLPDEHMAMALGIVNTAAEKLAQVRGPKAAAAMLYALADSFAVQGSVQTGIEDPKRKRK